jgi:hypothetical protein
VSEGIAPPFLTIAQDEGEWSGSRRRRFTLAKRAPATPKPVWTLWRREKYVADPENRTPAVQPIACRYAPAHNLVI